MPATVKKKPAGAAKTPTQNCVAWGPLYQKFERRPSANEKACEHHQYCNEFHLSLLSWLSQFPEMAG
jgi:hypothetical protein